MLNDIKTIVKYSTMSLDKSILQKSVTKILEGSADVLVDTDFKGTGEVKIGKMSVDGLGDYSRVGQPAGDGYSDYNQAGRDGYPVTGASLSWETFKLDNDRGAQFKIDSMDNEETENLALGKLQSTFNETAVIPEIDTIRLSKLAGLCSVDYGNKVVDETLTANEIISKFNDMFLYFTDNEVPEEDQVIFISSEVEKFINSTTELTRFMGVTERTISIGGEKTNNDGTANEMYQEVVTAFKSYNGRPLITVSKNRFFTDAVTSSNGVQKSATSKEINFLGVKLGAVAPIVKLQNFKIFDKSVVQDFDGSKANYRIYHDIFVPDRQLKCMYCSVSARSASTRALFVDYTNLVTKQVLVSRWRTNPSGINGKLVYKATLPVVGNVLTGFTDLAIGVTGAVTVGTGYFAILDYRDNKVLAVSKVKTFI